MKLWAGAAMGLAVLLASCGARAQEAAGPDGAPHGTPQDGTPQDGPVHTLRVFANLIQIPTLVLDERGRPVEEKTHPRFLLSLDGAKAFAPTHVRLEGDDPISLAVLLDASGSQQELLAEMPWALEALAEHGLRTQDHVSIYAMDCELVRSVEDAPAQKAVLHKGVERALKAPLLHGKSLRGVCGDKLALRDVLRTLAVKLAALPGRRVIVAVTNGDDRSGATEWAEVKATMLHHGITVFGLAAGPRTGIQPPTTYRGGVFSGITPSPLYSLGFDTMCQTSGGLVLTANDMSLRERLLQLVEMVRGRYILQFPRTREMAAGNHLLQVEVVGKNYFIRPAGQSVPIEDPGLKDDPTVLRVPAAEPAAAEPVLQRPILPPI